MHESNFLFLANSEAFEARSKVSSELVPSLNSVVNKLRTLDQLHAVAMPWHLGLAYSAHAIRTCNYSHISLDYSRIILVCLNMPNIHPGIISAGLFHTVKRSTNYYHVHHNNIRNPSVQPLVVKKNKPRCDL